MSAFLVLAFWAASSLPFVIKTLHPGFLELIASSSAWLLRRLGEDAVALGVGVRSPRFALEIRRGCDAIDPIALFVAATLAFPVKWRPRLTGVCVGILVLLTVNYARIISLYYVGIHAPASFETVHVDVWQPAFVLLSVVLWIGWAWWATSKPRSGPHVQSPAHSGSPPPPPTGDHTRRQPAE